MPTPSLIHPIPITITRPSNKVVYDPRTKEPIGGTLRDEEITIQGQIRFSVGGGIFNSKLVDTPGGVSDEGKGYVTVYMDELIDEGLLDSSNPDPNTLVGYKLSAIVNRVNQNYYIYQAEDLAHYDSNTLVKLRFGDRSPGNPVSSNGLT